MENRWNYSGNRAGERYLCRCNQFESFLHCQPEWHINFKAKDLFNQTEIWKTDGTTAGTVLLKDIFNTWIGGSSNPYPIATINGVALLEQLL